MQVHAHDGLTIECAEYDAERWVDGLDQDSHPFKLAGRLVLELDLHKVAGLVIWEHG